MKKAAVAHLRFVDDYAVGAVLILQRPSAGAADQRRVAAGDGDRRKHQIVVLAASDEQLIPFLLMFAAPLTRVPPSGRKSPFRRTVRNNYANILTLLYSPVQASVKKENEVCTQHMPGGGARKGLSRFSRPWYDIPIIFGREAAE